MHSSTDMGVSEYAGDGTIDPSVLCGGSKSLNTVGLLFQNTIEDDFMPPSGLGKGKGKGRAASMDARVESSMTLALLVVVRGFGKRADAMLLRMAMTTATRKLRARTQYPRPLS